MFQVFSIAHIEHIVAPNKGLANIAPALSVEPLLSVVELKIHIPVESNESALVLHAPLELDNHWLVDEVNEERLGVDRDWLGVLLGFGLRLCSCRHGLAAIWLN